MIMPRAMLNLNKIAKEKKQEMKIRDHCNEFQTGTSAKTILDSLPDLTSTHSMSSISLLEV